MSIDNQSQIIEVSLVKWINFLTQRNRILNFQQLSEGQFYMEMLTKIQSFKLTKPLKEIQECNQAKGEIGLATRISNMKTIGESILRFYQKILMRDVSTMKINYVELCLGKTSESIKLFSLIIGLISNTEDSIKQSLYQTIDKLNSEDQYIVRALLQNSKTIGQSMIHSKENLTLDNERKMLKKMEIYEDKIQNLQIQNQRYKAQIQQETTKSAFYQSQIKQLKQEKVKLIQKTQILEVLNARLQSENNSLLLQNSHLQKRLDFNKKNSEELIHMLEQKLKSNQKQIKLSQLIKVDCQSLKLINQEIKKQLLQKQQFWKGQENKFKIMKETYNHMKQKCKKTQIKVGLVEQQLQDIIHQSKNKISHKQTINYIYHYSNKKKQHLRDLNKNESNLEYILPKSTQKREDQYQKNGSSVQSSLKYRIPEHIGSNIKSHLSKYEMVNSNYIRIINDQQKNINSNYHTSGQMSVHLSQSQLLNTNFSNFLIKQNSNNRIPNSKQIKKQTSVSQFNEDQANFYRSQQGLDTSIIEQTSTIQEEPSSNRQKQFKRICLLQNLPSQIIKLISNLKSSTNSTSQYQSPSTQQIQTSQVQLLISFIKQLYSQNQILKNQLKILSKLEKTKVKRIQIFKQQLCKVREVQSCSSVNSKYQSQKQNLKNFYNIQRQTHLPLSLRNQQQRNGLSQRYKVDKNNAIENSSESSKLPYYITIN